MKKKFLSVFLVATIVASMTACGTSKDETTTVTTKTSNEKAETTTEVESETTTESGDASASNVVFNQDDITVTVVPNGDTEKVTITWLDGETTRNTTNTLPSTMEFYSATNYTKDDAILSSYEKLTLNTFENDYFVTIGDVVFVDYSNNSNGNVAVWNLLTNCATVDEIKAHNDELSASTGYENAFYNMMFAKVNYINSEYTTAFSDDEIELNKYGVYRNTPSVQEQDDSCLLISTNSMIRLPIVEDFENYYGVGATTISLNSDNPCWSFGYYSNIPNDELVAKNNKNSTIDYTTYMNNVNSQDVDVYYQMCINPVSYSLSDYSDIWTYNQ